MEEQEKDLSALPESQAKAASQELQEAQKEMASQEKNLETAKKELAKNEKALIKAQDELDRLEMPTYTVYTRETLPGCLLYTSPSPRDTYFNLVCRLLLETQKG